MTDAMKTAANNAQPAGTAGQFVPETRIISQAMYALAEEIQSGDGVANAACRQAAERLDAQTVEIERLRAALRTTQEPVAWAIFAESGAIRMWSKHQPHVKKVADAGGLEFAALYTTPPEASPRQPLTRETIRAIFMAHGFTIKEGQTDLKDYVYQAAEALLAAAHGIGAEKPVPQSQITEEMHQPAQDQVATAVLDEREACAKLMSDLREKSRNHLFRSALTVAEGEIRARGAA